MDESATRELYSNRRQALKVRAVLWASLLVLLICLYAGWSVFGTYGLNPGDGGVLKPFAERAAFGAGIALIGLLFAGGMWLYAGVYALRIARNGDTLLVETMSLLGRRRQTIDIGTVAGTRQHHGQLTLRQHVNAPWISVRLAGRFLPLMLDLQAERIDRNALYRLARRAK